MTLHSKYNLIVILGPTASGKTHLAVRLAGETGSEIISADSRQVFRGMDIGTGKDLDEFKVEGKEVPAHLIDIMEPGEDFSVYNFQKGFYAAFHETRERGIIPILVGGTGLYLDAVLRGYSMQEVPINEGLRREFEGENIANIADLLKAINPALHNTTDLLDKNRAIRALEIALFEKEHPPDDPHIPHISPIVFGIRWERKVLRERITKRLKERLEKGLIEEVERLHKEGISWERLDYFGLEYRFIGHYLQGLSDKNEMFSRLNTAIHQFAKRQETWFRRMERHGIKIHWIENADYGRLKEILDGERVFS